MKTKDFYLFCFRRNKNPASAFCCALSGETRFYGSKDWKNQTMASKSNPFTFLQQVRQEVAKVTWPSRRETVTTTIMVFIMIVVAALFFLAVDQVLSFAIGLLLNMGGA
jgi:preprotein translocase subunit SecE